MKMIVGLGNPGKRYEKTRHNTGFLVVDKIAEQCQVQINQNRFQALVAVAKVGNQQVLLMKPQTYMNLSGEAVLSAAQYYKIDPKDILVIMDDIDLPVGKIRIRENGSAGGQKGMKNIMDRLHETQIPRLRVGIGRNPLIDTVDYVLGKVESENKKQYSESLETAANASICFVIHGIIMAMNNFN